MFKKAQPYSIFIGTAILRIKDGHKLSYRSVAREPQLGESPSLWITNKLTWLLVHSICSGQLHAFWAHFQQMAAAHHKETQKAFKSASHGDYCHATARVGSGLWRHLNAFWSHLQEPPQIPSFHSPVSLSHVEVSKLTGPTKHETFGKLKSSWVVVVHGTSQTKNHHFSGSCSSQLKIVFPESCEEESLGIGKPRVKSVLQAFWIYLYLSYLWLIN